MDVAVWVVVALAFCTAGVGALGGLGGAVLLVPALVLLGVPPLEAAPLGLISVAAGSLSAGAAQLASGLVHHRLGVVTETAASTGAAVGALLSTAIPGAVLMRILGVAALGAAAVGFRRRGVRNPPDPLFAADSPGEWPGTLSGGYRSHGGVVPYTAGRIPPAVGVLGVAGLLAGLVGAGGGFLKTPVMSEIMRVPVKVAAATTTFTIGVTAAAALLVFALQGRVDPAAGAAVVFGATAGGRVGAVLQERLSPTPVRYVLSTLLVVVGLLFVVRG